MLDTDENPIHILWSQEGYRLAKQLDLLELLTELEDLADDARSQHGRALAVMGSWIQDARENPLHPLHSAEPELLEQLGLDQLHSEMLELAEADRAVREVTTQSLI